MSTRFRNTNILICIKSSLQVFLLVVFSIFSFPLSAQLSPGDIAFTGYNADGNDQFSFIATTNITGNEVIYFTDKGWVDENMDWNSNEGIIKYTLPVEGLTTGDMIIIQYINSSNHTVLQGDGSLDFIEGTFTLSTGGDQIFAFQTEDMVNYTPSFIAGINMNNKSGASTDNWGDIDASNTNTSETDLPDALLNGTNAIWVKIGGEADNSKYNNSKTQGTKSEISHSVNNVVNWSNDDDNHFTLGYSSTSTTISSGNWNEENTWDSGIPGKITDVTISHDITVTSDCAINDGSISAGSALTINPGETLTCNGTLTVNSDVSNSGAIIVKGIIIGNIAYQRYISGNRWYMLSSPVSGQNINSLLTEASNNIPINGSNYGMMDYNTSTNDFSSYFTSSTAGALALGKGYCMRRADNGTITFNGSAISTSVNANVSDAGSQWNLIGNPYPVSINATATADTDHNFLSENSSNLASSFTAIYVWDEQGNYTEERNDFKVINNSGSGTLIQNYLQACQGFFVKVKPGVSNLSFTTDMQNHQPSTAIKSGNLSWNSLKMKIKSESNEASTTIKFCNSMTKGLDIGYDAGLFTSNPVFCLYTKLMEDNGVDFMIQCLPDSFNNKMVIPIGVNAHEDTEIQFILADEDLPENVDIYLEDRLNQTSTNLKFNSEYNATHYEDGYGRFFLHIGEELQTSSKTQENNVRIIPDYQSNQLIISGNIQDENIICIYNISGKKVGEYKINNSNYNRIDFKQKTNGIYIIQIQGTQFLISRKIIWNK